ncbi:glycosyltransferase family 4 protein [Halorussus aquaticus]|uniref:Glycosyltransferase family 4 protein n=1 Tax=Halorussus aquaticus TaxID=2953748 RepID=A0ABD5PYE9_9EURY|nr:glycosyltransferase family 4 protein [Halorussus aquaticus]
MATVLVLARETPYPPNAGDRVVTHGFVRGLAERGHAVHVVAYGDESDRGRAESLADHAASVRLVARAKSDLPPRLRKLRNYATGRSDVMAMFGSPSMVAAARNGIRSLAPDAVLAQHPYIGQVFRDSGVRRAADEADATLVTNAHVVEFAVHRRYRTLASDLETRAELSLETPQLRREELAVYEASDRVLVLGSEDRAELVEAGVSTPIATQHVALDPAEYEVRDRRAARDDSDAADLLFFGSYGWFPNEDAVTTFAASAWPRIRAERPDARFVVAGRDAPDSVRELAARPGVEFVGEIPDLGRAVRDAAAVVAPLRIGGGTRLKVLESMAWGAPVVATAAGFEGVDARPGAEVAVADDWTGFAARAVELLDSPERRARLGRNARRRIEQVYALDGADAELEANLGLPSGT